MAAIVITEVGAKGGDLDLEQIGVGTWAEHFDHAEAGANISGQLLFPPPLHLRLNRH